jgi:alpha-beta hydrolase superfamily lysophospholipase
MTQKTYELLDRPEVLGVLFYPRRETGSPRLVADVHNVRIPVEGDLSVGGKIYAARPGAPVIVYFHGNGEIASDYDTIAPFYTSLGISLFVIDYRGYGASDGTPTSSALVNDARTSFRKARDVLAEHGVEAGDLFVMGRSLGSAAALEIADTCADEARDGFGNLEKISRAKLPTLIIHGERDWIIPVGDGVDLHEASPAADKTLVTVPGAGHNDLMMAGRRAYFDAIAKLCGGLETTT